MIINIQKYIQKLFTFNEKYIILYIKNMQNIILQKQLNYSRTGTAILKQDVCDICSNKNTCLVIDTSDDEYDSVSICIYCINSAYDEYLKELTLKDEVE